MCNHAVAMVEREVVLPAPRDEVWDAVVDGEWLGEDVELGPWSGGDVTVDDRSGTVEEVDEGERLVLTWARDGEAPTRVEIHLADCVAGTRLVVLETAPVRGPVLVAA